MVWVRFPERRLPNKTRFLEESMPKINQGDVLFVRVHPGNPNGRRSRAGVLFTVDETKLVVGSGDGEISVGRATMIAGDDGLVVRVESPKPLAAAVRMRSPAPPVAPPAPPAAPPPPTPAPPADTHKE
jgi:hypothetical protein